jgi:hypothetical protein|tara:strand:- start:201 stop:662 length:462 start_codon:yes stop_codon:yes gene_type:complete
MCNLNAFQRLEKDATELVAKKITEQTKLLMSVSKKYDTDFKDEDDLKELSNVIYSGDILYKEVTGSAIALDITSANSFIAYIFYINYKSGYNSSKVYSEVKFLDEKDYDEDYLKETLDKVVGDWVSIRTIQQDKDIERAKKRLTERQSETKVA